MESASLETNLNTSHVLIYPVGKGYVYTSNKI